MKMTKQKPFDTKELKPEVEEVFVSKDVQFIGGKE